ncbi:hypothetical protein K432DRAFT_421845 [Lepidopterella palustris CBS 459.81]|uniref:Uncharacterized protein n=1 Tax=Lepidopterella palustris CBS 459.81 TaxID=1314670 RepID=A0A8E2JK26_9PEZI|nr:hypothetical protein K432DRAFT_421845 [Lepidopterella palustris CBS 459.81]
MEKRSLKKAITNGTLAVPQHTLDPEGTLETRKERELELEMEIRKTNIKYKQEGDKKKSSDGPPLSTTKTMQNISSDPRGHHQTLSNNQKKALNDKAQPRVQNTEQSKMESRKAVDFQAHDLDQLTGLWSDGNNINGQYAFNTTIIPISNPASPQTPLKHPLPVKHITSPTLSFTTNPHRPPPPPPGFASQKALPIAPTTLSIATSSPHSPHTIPPPPTPPQRPDQAPPRKPSKDHPSRPQLPGSRTTRGRDARSKNLHPRSHISAIAAKSGSMYG